ncbi:2-dehydropantoate 2-reductase N-terminal domain-containing protein [Paraburkholderia sp. BR14261]
MLKPSSGGAASGQLPHRSRNALRTSGFQRHWGFNMKICIFGAGAIGGMMGVQLARAGADVSFVARGPHLAAMRENGARLLMDGEEYVAKVR